VKNELIGDPLEVKMFENTKWLLMENNDENDNEEVSLCKVTPQKDSNYNLSLVRRFDFSS
jgi:hypothetical protein